jgi:hypothetical protein
MRTVPEREGRRGGGGGGEERARKRWENDWSGVGGECECECESWVCDHRHGVIGVHAASALHGSTDPTSLTTLRNSFSLSLPPPPLPARSRPASTSFIARDDYLPSGYERGGYKDMEGVGAHTPEDSETLGPLRAFS